MVEDYKVEAQMPRICEELRVSAINSIGRKTKVISFSYGASQFKGINQIWLRTEDMKLYTALVKGSVVLCDYQEVKDNVQRS